MDTDRPGQVVRTRVRQALCVAVVDVGLGVGREMARVKAWHEGCGGHRGCGGRGRRPGKRGRAVRACQTSK